MAWFSCFSVLRLKRIYPLSKENLPRQQTLNPTKIKAVRICSPVVQLLGATRQILHTFVLRNLVHSITKPGGWGEGVF